MNIWRNHIAFMLLILGFHLQAQISPGDLSAAHSDLEGIKNCTQCHDLGKKVSSSKCLDCHDEIKELNEMSRGYHASREVKGKDCIECHSDHHGRKFDMVRFDQKKFNHGLTSFNLNGQHKVIDCRECHTPDLIGDQEIKKRNDTFLGMALECASCHEDFHQGTLAINTNCASCHNEEAFRPANGFDHAKTKYPLIGAHKSVECKECHAPTTLNGREFQEFAGVKFSDCIECHQDPHDNQLPGDCKRCHTEISFTQFNGQKKFNHNQTKFTLKGKHVSVNCFECHLSNHDPLMVFQDRLNVKENDCNACHVDQHEGRFGNTCTNCHNENTWQVANMVKDFNHDVTDFPLEGKHVSVQCKECHTSDSFTNPVDHANCFDCHEDFHEGQFTTNNIQTDCTICHTVEMGFQSTTFTASEHNETDFPLDGSHLATPCFACHVSEEKWEFRQIGANCVDCHDDIHQGQFAQNGSTECLTCHVTENWFPSLFDHNNTLFPLTGKHEDADCAACHKSQDTSGYIVYSLERFECVDCHLQ